MTCNGTDSAELTPSLLSSVPVTASGLQFVGLNVKPGRSMLTLTCLISSGIPSRIVGILYGPESSVVIVSAAVVGLTSIFARTMTFPRLNGPATAGLTIDSPYGAPS